MPQLRGVVQGVTGNVGFVAREMDVEWTKDGIAFYPTRPPRGRWNDDILDTERVDAIVVWWPGLVLLEAPEPWPSIRVRWTHAGASDERTFLPAQREAERLAAKIESLFGHAEQHKHDALVRGWLDVPEVPWEVVDALPTARGDPEGGGGPYRGSAAPSTERIVAERPDRMGAVGGWLLAIFRPSWREVAGEVVVTTEHVYVRRRKGTCLRVPLAALRDERPFHPHVDDCAYVFGRRTELVLTDVETCPVASVLRARLRTSS